VQGKLAVEMQRLIEQFDQQHPDIHVTAVYTGSYDDTNVKTHAAIAAGQPPGRDGRSGPGWPAPHDRRRSPGGRS